MCIGALGGRRIILEKTVNSGSQFYDYNGNFSIIMLAVVDADYKFIYVDVGASSRVSAGGVWNRCSMNRALEMEDNILNIPQIDNLPFSDKQCPFVLVGDDAFPLKAYLMRPYAEKELTDECRIFNYHLSRARKTSENAFGILSARFQVFKSPIRTSPTKAKDIALAALTLHNYLRVCSKESYTPADILAWEDVQNAKLLPGQLHQHPLGSLESLPLIARGHAREAKQIREKFKEYFNKEGRVPWQEKMC